jgi:uncharacterized protein (TIGR00299 family) protein
VTTIAWWHCYAGIAGDMALASLLDAGADLDGVRSILAALPVAGWKVEAAPVLRGGIAATHVVVRTAETGVVRTHAHIAGLLTEARLPDRVRTRALATFSALAEVEGRLHRRPPAQVHFHELGGIDAIVDIVGTCAALELLGVDQVFASPVATGLGLIRTSHGVLPNPAPAVVELLRGAPTYGRDVSVELTTPTGAALLSTLAAGWGPMPAMRVDATGFGAGTREIDGLPNSVEVVVGAAGAEAGEALVTSGRPAALLEANLDDVTGEVLAHAVAALLAAGAHDAWVTPVVMKKGRPGHVLGALCDPAIADQLAALMMVETGTLGVRGATVGRWLARRDLAEVEVDGFPVRVKISPGRVSAEHDDAARVARRLGLPLREVSWRAENEARHLAPGLPPETTPPAGPPEGEAG